jgi:hypothetical protein
MRGCEAHGLTCAQTVPEADQAKYPVALSVRFRLPEYCNQLLDREVFHKGA